MSFDRRVVDVKINFFQKRANIFVRFNDDKELYFPTWKKADTAKIFTEEFKQMILEKTGAELP